MERKIIELMNERLAINTQKQKFPQTLNPAEYCKLAVRDGDLKDKITLLETLLKRW
jgi:hypothetical protein